MKANPLPPLEALTERFALNPTYLTGLECKISVGSRSRVGEMAGNIDKDGYGRVRINYKHYKTHRIVYYLSTGVDPLQYQVDHIDQNKANNCITNLRLATASTNQFNTTKKSDNTSGVKGVSWYKQNNKWCAEIKIDGEKKYLGLFTNIDDAAAAYATAAKKYHGEFACLS